MNRGPSFRLISRRAYRSREALVSDRRSRGAAQEELEAGVARHVYWWVGAVRAFQTIPANPDVQYSPVPVHADFKRGDMQLRVLNIQPWPVLSIDNVEIMEGRGQSEEVPTEEVPTEKLPTEEVPTEEGLEDLPHRGPPI